MCLKENTIVTTAVCIHVRKISPITSLGCCATLPFPRMSIVGTMCKVVNGNVYAKVPIVGFFFFLFLRLMVFLVVMVLIRLDGDLPCGQ